MGPIWTKAKHTKGFSKIWPRFLGLQQKDKMYNFFLKVKNTYF